MNLEELTPQQLSDFAVDCFDRVYANMSHYDPTGEFRRAVDTARTRGDDAAAQQFSRKFVRMLCKGSPPANIVAAAKAGRECLLGHPLVVASLAVQASANPGVESKWQARHLQDMVD